MLATISVLAAALLCLTSVEAQTPSVSFRSSTMTFNNYNEGYKECKVFIANIVIFDCGLQYNAYQWSYLFRNAAADYSLGLKQNKQQGMTYKFKRLVDSNYPEGEGDFFVLKQSAQYNVDNVIT